MIKPNIPFEAFSKVDIRVGTIISVNDFPKAKKTAYQIVVDFGSLGIKKTSAQITYLYSKEDLLYRQVLAIINFQPKQIANFMSECLILGIHKTEKEVVLLKTNDKVTNGMSIS